MAERIDIRGYCVLTSFLSGFVYAAAVRWSWGGGFLSTLDPPFHDFAGWLLIEPAAHCSCRSASADAKGSILVCQALGSSIFLEARAPSPAATSLALA